jgi:hypothetical protein
MAGEMRNRRRQMIARTCGVPIARKCEAAYDESFRSPAARSMPRYVILHHETPPASPRPTHWDLMLENGEALRTWALACEPHPEAAIEAVPLPDHRREYLEYAGPVSDGRGTVSRWDEGTYRLVQETPKRLVIAFTGLRLSGEAMLERAESPPGDAQRWTFSVSAREACRNVGGDANSDSSVRPAR